MKTYEGSSGVTPFTTSDLDGGKSALSPSYFTPWERAPGTTLNRRHRIEAIIFKITEAHYLCYGHVFQDTHK
jgi:hypothetical protein